MTFKESIKELLENLVNSTLTKKIQWQVSKFSIDLLEVKVDDFLFSFHSSWKLELDTTYTLSKSWIAIKSDEIDFTVYSFNFPELMQRLEYFLYEEHYSKNKPCEKKLVSKILDVTKKISIEEYRDIKLNGILNSN